MAILNQKRILNLIPKVSAPVTIHVSQGDVGTEIEFTLVKGDELFVNPGNVSASVHGVREDGANFGAFTCTLSGSKVTFPLHSEMTAVKGSALAEIVLVDNGGNKVGSSNFGIMVEESVFPLGVTYDNDVSVYESILAYVQTIPAQVESDITAAVAQEASARATSDSIIRTNLANEISERTSADALINTRIDEIVAPTGEAPNPTEIVDARIGADGITYGNLGNAIRTQISDNISNMKTLHGRKVFMNLKAGYYIHQTRGIITTTNTWSVSELVYCHDWKCITLDNAGGSIGASYNGWFDENGNFISYFVLKGNGYSTIDVPSNAYYVAFSEETTKLVQWQLSYITKADVENDFNDFTSKMNDKYRNLGHDFILTTPIDIYSYGSLDPAYTANQYYRYRSSMLCADDEMFKHNNYTLEFNNSDYSVRVYYYKNSDDAIADYTGRSDWISDGSVKIEFTNNSRYIRLEFGWHTAEAYLYTPDLIKCVNSLVIYNITDKTSKYMRVCTFNMARDWSSFREHDFTDWQIAEYKKLFGEINADIIGMQEAYGELVDGVREPGFYVDMAHTKNMFDDVMANKYNTCDYFRATDQRTAIKYRYISSYNDYIDHDISSRTYQRTIIQLDNGLLAVYNTRLSYNGAYSEHQEPEMQALINVIATDKASIGFKWVIICGDFNVWDASNYDIFVTNGYKLCNCGDFGLITTWAWENYVDHDDGDKLWNMSPTDNIIVSSNIDIQNIGVVELYEPFDPSQHGSQWPIWDNVNNKPNALSDHYPFYADLLLND